MFPGIIGIAGAINNNNKTLLNDLIANGADVNDDEIGLTPLYRAVILKNFEFVRILLEAKADVNKPTVQTSYTPLTKAADDGYIDILNVMTCDVNA